MNALGSISQIYMLVLLILLAAGIGLAIWRFASFLMGRICAKENTEKKKTGIPILSAAGAAGSLSSQNGGSFMKRNGWLNLAAFSLAGLLVSVIFMGFMYSKSSASQYSGNGHQDMQAQGGMNINTPMGNVQMQGAMYGNAAQNDNYQQQIIGMQQQLAQLQQQMGGSMGGNMQMQQSGMNSMMDDMMAKMDTMMNSMGSAGSMNGSGSMDSMMNEMMSKMDTMMNMMNSANNMNGMNSMNGSGSMNSMNSSSNMNGMMDDMMNMMDDMMGMMNIMQQQNSSMPMM